MGCRITVVEFLPNILPMMDPEMAALVEEHFESKGVRIKTSTKVTAFEGDGKVEKVVTDQGEIPADIVIMAVGVRPATKLAVAAGLEIGPTRAIAVNEQMQTSDPDIFAAGDCAEKKNIITGKPCYVPLGSTANKEGRVAANAICGQPDAFPGVLGSAICKIFDFSVARTGLGEQEARDDGYDVGTSTALTDADDEGVPESGRPFVDSEEAGRGQGNLQTINGAEEILGVTGGVVTGATCGDNGVRYALLADVVDDFFNVVLFVA